MENHHFQWVNPLFRLGHFQQQTVSHYQRVKQFQNMFYLSIYWEESSQLLLTHIFQRGRSTTKQCMFDGFDTSFHPDEYHVKCPGKWVENHFILCTALVVKCIKNNGEKKQGGNDHCTQLSFMAVTNAYFQTVTVKCKWM